ncbi:polysaccharide biosynthesis protein [Fredinandcohnia onubensis]|uniref:polysaccharide biosynthesis protein n=1 Tax=Fredinandcohnia onubensis TaxID=1571209 RepID=UPI000C0BCD24|nr:nucleoside-diphosphate sugar epimerase/dehydratase [Fredinandcohnia onubensis]
MSYRKRLGSLVIVDSIIVLTAIYISYFMLHPYFQIFTMPFLLISSITLLASHHVFAYVYRLYKRAWEYASIGELMSIAKAVTFSIAVLGVVQLLAMGNVYVRVLILTWMMHILFIGGSRFSWRIFRDSFIKDTKVRKRTLIVGAGAAGTMLARQMIHNHDLDLKPVAFVDDDVKKQNLQIYNVPVLGGVSSIEEIVKSKNIENIIIAIPSLSKKELNDIFQECSKTKAKTQIMPLIEDVMLGKVTVNSFRDVEVEDLLGREPVQLDTASISEKLTGKTILVTGAGGSIGSEICRQVSMFNPKKLVLVGHGENSIYLIDMELRNKYKQQFEIIPVIGDVQDRNRMFEVIETHAPDVVYHAAAHKHVPLMEYNPKEAVKNNVFGTRNVAEACHTFGVKNFVLVSTDKAVNPTNVMGATKRMAELVIQNLALSSKTKFAAVRFGNVLGSRGSVIPLFKKQIQAGGPVTVTHPEMTRYFMTIPEASRLVLQAGALARGGEIFVLDMGEPVKIVDLAKNLITLSGYTLDEIEIRFSGLRPGEKMFEELLNDDEIHLDKGQIYPKIYIGKTYNLYTEEVKEILERGLELEVGELSKRLIDLANNRVEPKVEKLVLV